MYTAVIFIVILIIWRLDASIKSLSYTLYSAGVVALLLVGVGYFKRQKLHNLGPAWIIAGIYGVILVANLFVLYNTFLYLVNLL